MFCTVPKQEACRRFDGLRLLFCCMEDEWPGFAPRNLKIRCYTLSCITISHREGVLFMSKALSGRLGFGLRAERISPVTHVVADICVGCLAVTAVVWFGTHTIFADQTNVNTNVTPNGGTVTESYTLEQEGSNRVWVSADGTAYAVRSQAQDEGSLLSINGVSVPVPASVAQYYQDHRTGYGDYGVPGEQYLQNQYMVPSDTGVSIGRTVTVTFMEKDGYIQIPDPSNPTQMIWAKFGPMGMSMKSSLS